ncbi:tryptophan synthase subunit alpha [Legionella birminghamensis]|uniref:Tryptophan synthase alpha chain n=1 Tax=Legionella birminghamensis TaxID=28083 RepID=A0A378I8A3_9GAMM|nr:tryptophan synthase subunit alpha [Legionella birminghamensis]KTC67902.1 tryptophan synthase subunit alpha [Legionella birminghamensis]STX31389.1 tryptophan synthase alpha chain [Legionella birminghamensis]
MNRIDKTLSALKAANKKMLSPYITAGDPTPRHTVDLMHALVDAGADVLEIGIPFSDPMAEGPVIQAAMERALNHQVNCEQVLDMVSEFRRKDSQTPIVIMGYVNPVEIYGYERFAIKAQQAGVDGTILVDLPPEESKTVSAIWKAHGLYSIYLCSPTTSDERMKLINEYGQGYLYYVSLKGVTGSDALDMKAVKDNYQYRKTQTNLPLMVGFGIKTPQMAASVSEFSEGVIVGAALINTMIEAYNHKQDINLAAKTLINSMRNAIDGKNDE